MAVIRRQLGNVITNVPKPLYNFGDATGGGQTATYEPPTTSTGGAGSILSGQASLQRAALDRQKYQAELQAAADAVARQQAGAQAQEAYLRSQLGAGIPGAITGAIEEQERTGRQYIEDQAAALLGQLQQRQSEATGLTQTGYSNLMNYLARNQPTAFAQAQRAMPTITETGLGQYMAGQGVSPAAAQEAASLANIQAAGGASNYNQLLNVLAAQEQSAQGSRQAESEMGLSSALARLQAIYGQGTAGLEQQRLGALAQLAQQISAARLQAAQQQAAREQAIRDALGSLYGTGLVKPPVAPGGDVPGGAVPGGDVPGGAAPIFSPQDPGLIAAAEAQGVSPQMLYDLAMGANGNPMFGALQNRMYMI